MRSSLFPVSDVSCVFSLLILAEESVSILFSLNSISSCRFMRDIFFVFLMIQSYLAQVQHIGTSHTTKLNLNYHHIHICIHFATRNIVFMDICKFILIYTCIFLTYYLNLWHGLITLYNSSVINIFAKPRKT